MKTIEIKNKIIYLDDEDYELVKNNKLYLLNSRGRLFARALINGVQHTVHRLILGYPKNRIAFKDGNTLNLQKDNLQLINEEYQKEQKRKYYNKNKELICKRSNEWAKNNKEKLKKTRKEYSKTKTHKENRKKYRQKTEVKIKYNTYYRSKTREIKYRYNAAKHRAARKNHVFEITESQYTQYLNNGCYYCGCSLFIENGIGLDRINNSIGYTKENVLPCCGSCNKTRGDRFTVEETKIMIMALLEHRNNLCYKDSMDGLVKLEDK